MSVRVKIYNPGDEVPYDPKQFDSLCKPELIYPSDVMDKDWKNKGYTILLVKKETPIGILLASIRKNFMYLAILCVAPDERGSGYGKQLLDALDTVTRTTSVNKIRVSAILTQLDFYKRGGFVPIEVIKPELDYVAMEKVLKGGARRRTLRRRNRTVNRRRQCTSPRASSSSKPTPGIR